MYTDLAAQAAKEGSLATIIGELGGTAEQSAEGASLGGVEKVSPADAWFLITGKSWVEGRGGGATHPFSILVPTPRPLVSGSGSSSSSSSGRENPSHTPTPPPSLNNAGTFVDQYSFDTFLGDGKGYFASQDAFSSAQALAAQAAARKQLIPTTTPSVDSDIQSLNNLIQSSKLLVDLPPSTHPIHKLGPLNPLLIGYLPLIAVTLRPKASKNSPSGQQAMRSIFNDPALPRVPLFLMRYALFAYDCIIDLPPLSEFQAALGESNSPSSSRIRAFSSRLHVQCASNPRAGVPSSFLELFQRQGLLSPEAHSILTPLGMGYFEALVEEQKAWEKSGTRWEVILAAETANFKTLTPNLAKVIGWGMPILVSST